MTTLTIMYEHFNLKHLFISIFLMSLFRECLKGTIVNNRDAEVSCPENCDSKLLDREIQAVSGRLEIKQCLNGQTVQNLKHQSHPKVNGK